MVTVGFLPVLKRRGWQPPQPIFPVWGPWTKMTSPVGLTVKVTFLISWQRPHWEREKAILPWHHPHDFPRSISAMVTGRLLFSR
jgi:hypothetical protein